MTGPLSPTMKLGLSEISREMAMDSRQSIWAALHDLETTDETSPEYEDKRESVQFTLKLAMAELGVTAEVFAEKFEWAARLWNDVDLGLAIGLSEAEEVIDKTTPFDGKASPLPESFLRSVTVALSNVAVMAHDCHPKAPVMDFSGGGSNA